MNILKIKQTMIDKSIPADVMERFVFPESEDEMPEEKVADQVTWAILPYVKDQYEN